MSNFRSGTFRDTILRPTNFRPGGDSIINFMLLDLIPLSDSGLDNLSTALSDPVIFSETVGLNMEGVDSTIDNISISEMLIFTLITSGGNNQPCTDPYWPIQGDVEFL